jgi:sulfite exporter TauE/SafE
VRTGRGPFIVGLLNGLMPCGPLQAMQLYALSTGSVIMGAASMFVFSAGTVPLMFALGAVNSVLNARFSRVMTTVSAVLVLVLGLAMLTNALALLGINLGG